MSELNNQTLQENTSNNGNDVNEKKKFFDKKTILTIVITIIVILLLKFIAVGIILGTRNNHTNTNQQLLNYLNSALRADGNTHKTMYSALSDTHNHGFYPEYISNDLEDAEIMWDMQNDCYLIKNDKNEFIYQDNTKIKAANPYDLWQMRNDFPSEQYYSIYLLGTNYREDIGSKDKPLVVGFDAGNNKYIKNVFYGENNVKEEVTIRTLNGTLNINDSLDTVNHYGNLDKIELINTSFESLHEFGNTTFVEAHRGRYVIESGAKVGAIHLIFNSEANKFDDLIFAIDPTVDTPMFSRDSVPEGSNMVLLCGLQTTEDTSQTTYIWLYQDGIYPQMIYTSTNKPASDVDFIDGSNNSDQVKTTAKALANDYNGPTDADGNPVYKEGEEDNRVLEDNSGVSETGKTTEEAQEQAENNINIIANSSSYTSLGLEHPSAQCYELNDSGLGNSSVYKLDEAYMYRGFSEEEQALLNKLFDLKDENGKRFFRADHQEDYKNEEIIESALNMYEDIYGSDEANEIKELYYSRYEFLSYRVDFEVSFNKKINKNSVAFAGQYEANDKYTTDYNWVGFLSNETNANEPVRFLETAYNLLDKEDFRISLAEVLGYVKVFNAGVANLSEANIGTEVTVNLYCYEVIDNIETGNKILCNSHTYTFGEVNSENIK